MKHLKLYEKFIEEFEVGNIVYCINNKMYEEELEIGKKYTIQWVFNNMLITLREFPETLFKSRFTKDPNHPAIIEYTADKFNL